MTEHEGAEPEDPTPKDQPCPACGQVHSAIQWTPNDALEIDRDITAIVMAVLNGGTVKDFAELVGDSKRLPSMLLRACQFIAQLYLALAHEAAETSDHDVAMAVAKDLLTRALLAYSVGESILTEDDEGGEDNG